MKAIQHDNKALERSEVVTIHYMPFDEKYGLGKTEEELRDEGYLLVEFIPDPEANGKVSKLYVNQTTLELWYEYEDSPLTSEQEIEQLQDADLDNKEAIASLFEMMLIGGV